VTAVWVGHEHLYQRVYVRTGDREGFWHVTTAGGGAPLYRVTPEARAEALAEPLPKPLRIDPNSVFSECDFHFCRLVIPRKNVSGADRLSLEVYRVRGNGIPVLLDRLDLARGPEQPRGLLRRGSRSPGGPARPPTGRRPPNPLTSPGLDRSGEVPPGQPFRKTADRLSA
jgi:hypothetical protein